MTATALPTTTAPVQRGVPALGGFSLTFLQLETRRLLRNRRTLVFSLVMPPAFFFLFGGSAQSGESAGRGNVSAYIMISLMVYGAMLATTSAGASVAVERAQGWSRQLRLTPLDPVAYMATKALSALVLGAMSIATVMVAGAVGGASMPAWAWVVAALVAWVGAMVFAAFGLFMGYLLPSENVMQLLGPALALLAFLGGLFVPLDLLGSTFRSIAQFTPAYGVGALARLPLTGDPMSWGALANVVVWTAVFVTGAVLRFRRDTARV
ncbi:ABC transporter permease [Modestobacter sp. I12A-02628]|uniref:Transport permease protein n=1 Tax=Goekera deserti TaxID=2497753 RepID=A0A7K3WAY1_9ACTN|nr:ABC transporter permease [Goekera deserti]MPQ97516.1 ABC transporter permease [Goekera deserti]NDI47880.1 ABC transporter permease [Goekera deserti]NEL53628.1 ABC transporter permease [Goekera deserti]